MNAEKEYGSTVPYLTYKLFNVEEPIAGQGIAAGKFDLVIAANVLHATKTFAKPCVIPKRHSGVTDCFS